MSFWKNLPLVPETKLVLKFVPSAREVSSTMTEWKTDAFLMVLPIIVLLLNAATESLRLVLITREDTSWLKERTKRDEKANSAASRLPLLKNIFIPNRDEWSSFSERWPG